jgi:hypothetical protein
MELPHGWRGRLPPGVKGTSSTNMATLQAMSTIEERKEERAKPTVDASTCLYTGVTRDS